MPLSRLPHTAARRGLRADPRVALLDTNVLFPFRKRDILLRFHHDVCFCVAIHVYVRIIIDLNFCNSIYFR